jgi:hypothetical protein
VDANPAEWMLQILEPPTDGSKGPEWYQIWRDSPEYHAVKKELGRLRALPAASPAKYDGATHGDKSQHQEFVASFWTQFREVLLRTSKHFWRSPTYIWSKITLITLSVSDATIPRNSVSAVDQQSILVTVSRLQLQCQQFYARTTKPTVGYFYATRFIPQLQ